MHFGRLLRAVQEDGDTIVVERGGRAVAVILPIAAYESMKNADQTEGWQVQIAALHALWEREMGKRQLPDAVEMLRQGRDERGDQLAETLRR